MKTTLLALFLCAGLAAPFDSFAKEQKKPKNELSLITSTAEEGFALAVSLARKGVSTTQPDKKVLFEQREVYAKDAGFLIAASQVIAIHFQTVAAANNYWRDESD